MVTLNILSGGAAQGLVRALADDFESQHDLHLSGTFGAVGAMKQKLTDGTPCDVLILTRPMVQDLIQQGLAMADTAQDLGVVKTGVAVLADRLRPHPNGATAMKAMGLSKDPKAIGCTQVTEILSTPGVQLVGDLPKAHELATVYTAVLAKRARQVDMAQALVALMASPALAELRTELGFLPV